MDQVKDYIVREVEGTTRFQDIVRNNKDFDLEHTVDVFLDLLKCDIDDSNLNGVGNRVLYALNKISDDNAIISLDELHSLLIDINATELYARIVVEIIDKEKYEEIVDNKKAYYDVLKRVMNGKDSTSADKMRERRNMVDVHQCKSWSKTKTQNCIISFLIDYLIITNKQIELLEDYLKDKKEVNNYYSAEYILDIVQEYKEKVENGFVYIDVHWVGEQEKTVDKSIDSLIEMIKEQPQAIKFLGEAGLGKTTALERIQYKVAQQYSENKTDLIPVLITLGSIISKEKTLQDIVEKTLKIDNNQLNELLEEGRILFLLDGFNEILDDEIMKNISKEIDYTIRDRWSKNTVILSDRTLIRNRIRVLNDSVKLILKDIDIGAKREYFKEKLDSEMFDKVNNDIDSNPRYYDALDTPYMMYQFVEVVNNTREIPDDIIHTYLTNKIEREKTEKKEVYMRDIELYLEALAYYIYNENKRYSQNRLNEVRDKNYSKMEVLRKLAEIKDSLGFNTDTNKLLDVAVGLGILKEENKQIQFYNYDYLYYFYTKGLEDEVDKLF